MNIQEIQVLVIKITAALPGSSQGECCCHSLAEGKAKEIYFFCNAFTLQRNQGEIKPIITVLKSKIYRRRIQMQFVGRLLSAPRKYNKNTNQLAEIGL